MAKVDAIIIGGGTISDPAFRAAAGVDCKSLISISGKPMIYWVAKALKETPGIGSVVAIGPQTLLETELIDVADHVLLEGEHEVVNLLRGMDAIPESERALMVSGDTPLLTPEAVSDLIENAPEADIVYPTVGKDAIMSQFPDRKWIYIKALEGEFTGSSTVMFKPDVFRQHQDTLKKVFDARRSVADLVKMWGIGFALKFALGQLSLKDAERRISEVLNVNGRAYISEYPELAFDVDKASDIALAEARLSERG